VILAVDIDPGARGARQGAMGHGALVLLPCAHCSVAPLPFVWPETSGCRDCTPSGRFCPRAFGRCCLPDRSLPVQGRRRLSGHRQQIDTVQSFGILFTWRQIGISRLKNLTQLACDCNFAGEHSLASRYYAIKLLSIAPVKFASAKPENWQYINSSGFQLDEVHARNPVTLAKPGFSVPHSYKKRYICFSF